ncbi:class I SAM-dependent methyltransferase [uncultured Methanobrevibacter sp.]|uniref:class I SAM-dependent methyltransferase n=1 Tax=uncultured Methanobrevibacter sp. TaxID=253161 RepID=UPI00262D4D87|nr:methyltransferase domain-containing protein [uncultured Methanobrevibacter sp.]
MEHKHHAKSSANFLDSDEILRELNLKGNEVFMDAGCGDGYISIKAINEYLPDGIVYAVDSYDVAIEELNEYKQENNIENLITVLGDFTEGIVDVCDGEIDVILMLNVFHGFQDTKTRDAVIEELSRLINDEGRIAIMEFRPIDWSFGPPTEIKCSPDELEEIFSKHNLKKVHLNENMGQKSPEGNSHFMIIFEKE